MSDTSSGATEKPIERRWKKAIGKTSGSSDERSPPNLCDMPLDVVGLIIERSDYKEQLILRKVSKSLRSLVDQKKPSCTRLEVLCKWDHVRCDYNTYRVAYAIPKLADDKPFYRSRNINKTISRADFEKVAFDDLALTLKNPKLQLETFSFHSEKHWYHTTFSKDDGDKADEKYMKDVLKSINHQISPKSFEIDMSCPSIAISILPYLKPGVLEKIKVIDNYGWSDEKMDQLSLLDQWRQAEELDLRCGFDDLLMEYATHFKRFRFEEFNIFGAKLVDIREWLAKLDNFEFCLIDLLGRRTRPIDAREFCAAIGEPALPNEQTEYVSHYSIPNSNDYLEFLFFEVTIEIRKMKRSNSG